MRAVRIVLATALTVSAAAGMISAQAAPTPPFTAVTGSGNPVYGGGKPFAFAGAAVSVSGATTAGIGFHVPDPNNALDIQVTPPTGAELAPGTHYATNRVPDATHAGLDITYGSGGCGSASGTVDVGALTSSGGNVTEFAASYSFSCDGNGPVSGQLRFNSTTDYRVVVPSALSWDFGSQLIKHNGWAKSFVFVNRGTVAQTFAAPSLTNTKSFSIGTNTCKFSVPAGGSCMITVTPHPQTLIARTNLAETGTLSVTPTGLPALKVSLRVLGIDHYPFAAIPGPQRITVHWDRLPTAIDAYDYQVRVYRGTSPTALSPWRTMPSGDVQTTDHGAVAGSTYYYAVRPLDFFSGALGDWSPVVAARAWPKYSAGMYHRLGSPVRIVSGHRVSAGHTYSVKVLGAHGVPASQVSAVALNVTAATSTATSSVFVYPFGTRRPAAADIAVRAHDTRSNFVLAKVGKYGRIAISTAHGSVPVSVDVFGYFSGAGLSSRYGMGGALHEYGYPGTIMDTKAWRIGALPYGYYVNAPVNFDPADTPHVTSLLVEVTAYGSKGSGSITGFSTGARPNGTSVLSYRPNTTTSAAAIVRAGRWYGSDGNAYPSVSFLNRGAKRVQLVVTILGFVDDNTFVYGQRYVPTAPVHLLGATMSAGSNRTIVPGRHGGYWTSAFNEKLSAARPSRGTTVSLRGVGLGAAPSHGQLHAGAHVTTISSTIGVTGSTGNRIVVHNAAGTVRVDVWSFGRFDIYPAPTTRNYASGGSPAALRQISRGAAPGSARQRGSVAPGWCLRRS